MFRLYSFTPYSPFLYFYNYSHIKKSLNNTESFSGIIGQDVTDIETLYRWRDSDWGWACFRYCPSVWGIWVVIFSSTFSVVRINPGGAVLSLFSMFCLTFVPVLCRAPGAQRTRHRGGSLRSFGSVRRLHHCGYRPASGSHHVRRRREERHAQTCEFNLVFVGGCGNCSWSFSVAACFTFMQGAFVLCWPLKSKNRPEEQLKLTKTGQIAPDSWVLNVGSEHMLSDCVITGTAPWLVAMITDVLLGKSCKSLNSSMFLCQNRYAH